MHPITGMCANLHITYSGYFGTNPRATTKFGLSAMPSLSVFTTLTIWGMLNCLQLLLFCSMMMATTTLTIGTTRDDSRQKVVAP
jgi:hypothetical protein